MGSLPGTVGSPGCADLKQISAGEENRLALRVYGTDASLEWHQQAPNVLTVRRANAPTETFTPGHPFLVPAARRGTRMPPGHPEGLLEAFANIYRGFAGAIRGAAPAMWYPGVDDGVRTMAFVEAVVGNAQSDVKWSALG